jgi:signal transduction histidine kinase
VTVFTGRSGRITGKTPFSRIRKWNADGRASGNVWLLEIHEDQFPALLTAIPSMTERIVRVLIDRNKEYTRAEEQTGKLAALGKLAGNLAHELNNPASAARSAALALSQNYELAKNDARYQFSLKVQNQAALDRYIQELDALRLSIRSVSHARNSMAAGELEEVLSDWLRNKGLEEAWKLAPILAEAEVSIRHLQEFLAAVPSELEPLALRDLLQTVMQDAAIASVLQASERIFRIVAAVKDYSYMDRQPVRKSILRLPWTMC